MHRWVPSRCGCIVSACAKSPRVHGFSAAHSETPRANPCTIALLVHPSALHPHLAATHPYTFALLAHGSGGHPHLNVCGRATSESRAPRPRVRSCTSSVATPTRIQAEMQVRTQEPTGAPLRGEATDFSFMRDGGDYDVFSLRELHLRRRQCPHKPKRPPPHPHRETRPHRVPRTPHPPRPSRERRPHHPQMQPGAPRPTLTPRLPQLPRLPRTRLRHPRRSPNRCSRA